MSSTAGSRLLWVASVALFVVAFEIAVAVHGDARSGALLADIGHNVPELLGHGALVLRLVYRRAINSERIVAISMLLGGIAAAAFCAYRLANPENVGDLELLATVVALIGNMTCAALLKSISRGHRDVQLQALHLTMDSAIGFGAVVGVLVATFGVLWVDALAGISMGLAMALMAIFHLAIKHRARTS